MESTWKENLTGNTKEVHLYRTAQMHFQERSAVHVERDYMLRTPPIACNGFIEAACHRTGTSSISAHLCDKTSTHSLHCITLHYITFGRWNPSFPRIVPQFGEFQGISGNFREFQETSHENGKIRSIRIVICCCCSVAAAVWMTTQVR